MTCVNYARETTDEPRRLHNARQVELFDAAADSFLAPIPTEIQQRTERIVAAAALPTNARVLDVGTGAGVLIAHLQAAGAGRIVACDVSSRMLKHARMRYGDAAEFVQCDILDLPAGLGPFDAVFFNAVFGNLYDPVAALRQTLALLTGGGQVVISHPMGRSWHRRLRERYPDMVLRDLPDRAAAEYLLATAGLRPRLFVDEPDLYLLIATTS